MCSNKNSIMYFPLWRVVGKMEKLSSPFGNDRYIRKLAQQPRAVKNLLVSSLNLRITSVILFWKNRLGLRTNLRISSMIESCRCWYIVTYYYLEVVYNREVPKLTFLGRRQLATEFFFQSPYAKIWSPKSVKVPITPKNVFHLV